MMDLVLGRRWLIYLTLHCINVNSKNLTIFLEHGVNKLNFFFLIPGKSLFNRKASMIDDRVIANNDLDVNSI